VATTPLLLRRVHNHFWSGLARFKLGTHLLDLRGLLFELCCENFQSLGLLRNGGFQVLHLAVPGGFICTLLWKSERAATGKRLFQLIQIHLPLNSYLPSITLACRVEVSRL
jgi:hypothetical protein